MEKGYLFLADGFEEIEGLTVIDILRRGKVEVETVSVTGRRTVTGSHGIPVTADLLFDADRLADGTLFVLPGGMPGTRHLAAHEGLAKLLLEAHAAGKRVAAICAAPSVLGGLGILKGKTAVCYPGFEEALEGATLGSGKVEVSGNVTTSRGMGTAVPFALCLLAQLKGQEKADEVARGILWEC